MNKEVWKEYIEKEITKLLKLAEREGIGIYVASDEEGNNFNEIYALYRDANENSICLSVIGTNEEDIFDY